jgi:VWFA-related protein
MSDTSRAARALIAALLSISLIHTQSFAIQAGRQRPVETGAAQEGTLRVTTRLVQISVVVHDKSGKPVRDLKKEDFELFDKGQAQMIQFFSSESDEPLPGNAPPLAPGVVSNRFVNSTAGGKPHLAPLPASLTVILLDGLNTAFTDQHYAKEALIKFLNQLQPGDRVAIYTLSNGLRVLHDFTSDTESLLATLAKHRNQDSFSLNASSYDDANTGDDTLDAFLDQANERIANFYQARRTETTLAALQTISQHLAGMPGRKNLVWLSGSFPTIVGQGTNGTLGPDFQNYSESMKMALRTLNDVGIAIYPVDARGLIGAFDFMPSMSPSSRAPNPRRRGMQPVDQRAQNQIIQTQGTMREIADRTGGRAFINTNDITGAIRRAVDDSRFTYTLAYTPTHDQWDGKFREIKIKVNRPGVDVRYRQGYYAYPDNPSDQRTRQAILAEVAATPLLSTGLGLVAGAPQRPTPEQPHSLVRVAMDAHELGFLRNPEGNQEADLDVFVVIFDRAGKALHQQSTTVRLKFDPAQYAEVLKTGVLLNADSQAPAGASRARVVVHDLSSGAIGSVDVALK